MDHDALERALAAGDDLALRRALAPLPEDREQRDRVFDLLVAAAHAGSDLARQAIVETVDRTGLARAAAARFLIDDDGIEEVAQEVLLGISSSLSAFGGEARFTTWVHSIARHRAIDHLRRRREALPLDDRTPGPVERISSLIAGRERVDELLARLPDTYRHAVALRDVQQLSYAEVAGRLGCQESTARTRVARGRALVAGLLAAEGAP